MAIIKQGILGGFKKKIGSVVGSSWKGVATMRSLPLSVANPKTAAQVENRNRFKACAGFASLILSSIIKPLMDRFAGQMSGYNYFTKLNKEVFANPSSPTWADLVIAKGRMLAPVLDDNTMAADSLSVSFVEETSDKFGLPTDKIYALVVRKDNQKILFAGDTGAVRSDYTATINFSEEVEVRKDIEIYVAYLRADGSEVSNTLYTETSRA